MGNTLAGMRSSYFNFDPNVLLLPEEPQIFELSLTSLLDSLHSVIAQSKGTKPSNPGSVAELHSLCKALQPVPLIGGKLAYNIRLDAKLQLSRALRLAGYCNGGISPAQASCFGTNQYGVYPMLTGEVDSVGNLYANIVHEFNKRIRSTFTINMSNLCANVAQLATDYRADDYTMSLTLGNPNLLKDTGVITGSFLKAVTHRLAIGSELTYHYGPHVPRGHEADLAAVVRCQLADSSLWCGTVSTSAVQITYWQKVRELMQIGFELKTDVQTKKLGAIVAYQIEMPRDDMRLRASLDSNWNVCGVLEKRFESLPFTVLVCGQLNHATNKAKFGCALTMG